MNITDFINIVQCDILEKPETRFSDAITCWKTAQKTNDFRFINNVCLDCIVYLYIEENKMLTRHDIDKILHARKMSSN